MVDLPQDLKGKSREIAAAKLGISGTTAEHGADVVDAIDDLRKKKKTADAEILKNLLNKSFDGAYKKARSSGFIKTKPKQTKEGVGSRKPPRVKGEPSERGRTAFPTPIDEKKNDKAAGLWIRSNTSCSLRGKQEVVNLQPLKGKPGSKACSKRLINYLATLGVTAD